MDSQSQTITNTLGKFSVGENGIIYFQQVDNFITDERAAAAILESVFALDNSGAARVIVIQGQGVEYSFKSILALITSHVVSQLAFVAQTKTQLLTSGLLKQLAKTLKAQFAIELFSSVEHAEAWLREEPEYMAIPFTVV